MEATVSVVDTARSLWVIYRQMPTEAQKMFREMITNEPPDTYENNDWLSLSALSIEELWNQPEEDYWDELYAKQKAAKQV